MIHGNQVVESARRAGCIGIGRNAFVSGEMAFNISKAVSFMMSHAFIDNRHCWLVVIQKMLAERFARSKCLEALECDQYWLLHAMYGFQKLVRPKVVGLLATTACYNVKLSQEVVF